MFSMNILMTLLNTIMAMEEIEPATLLMVEGLNEQTANPSVANDKIELPKIEEHFKSMFYGDLIKENNNTEENSNSNSNEEENKESEEDVSERDE